MADLFVEIKRTNSKVHFEGVSKANPNNVIPFDFAPPLGDGDGYAGLELLLMSFAGCVSTTVVYLLTSAGKQISAYAAKAQGIRRERPLSLSNIIFNIEIKSDDLTGEDIDKAIRQAEAISPVWQAVKNNVTVETSFQLL